MPDEGFRKWLGVEYEIMEDGHAVVGLNITDDMRNLRQVVQGGVVAALVDIAMATAAAEQTLMKSRRERPPAPLVVPTSTSLHSLHFIVQPPFRGYVCGNGSVV